MSNITDIFGFKAWEFDLALRYLRTRRKDGGIAIIAWISFIGIGLAVFALISIMSIMNGFQSELMTRLLSFNGHDYVLGPPLNDLVSRDEMLKRLRSVPEVISVTPFVESPTLAQGSTSQLGPAYVRGIDAKALKTTPIVKDIVQGTIDDFGVGDYGGNTVIIGEGLAQNMALIPGDNLTLMTLGGSTAFGTLPKRKVYTVGGVFKSGISELDATFVFMPLQQAQLFFSREDAWDAIEIKVKDPLNIEALEPGFLKIVGSSAILQNWKQRNSAIWGALKFERNAMRIILSFVVLIAVLNIISGIVMLVKNKTRDIAILRTLGADRASITRVFFITGAVIGVAGTIAGFILGVIFVLNIGAIQTFIEWLFQIKVFDSKVYFLSQVPAKLVWSEVILVVIGSFVAACVCTIFPARWASRLEPVEALRYE